MLNIQTKYIVIGVLVLALLAFVYFTGKKSGNKQKPKPLKLPNNGSGIPEDWSPVNDVVRLYEAMDGMGTDEEAIYWVLTGKTDDQLAAIYNEYGNRYGEDLIEALRDELSGEELSRALDYFKNII